MASVCASSATKNPRRVVCYANHAGVKKFDSPRFDEKTKPQSIPRRRSRRHCSSRSTLAASNRDCRCSSRKAVGRDFAADFKPPRNGRGE